jgi:hypothetical protein
MTTTDDSMARYTKSETATFTFVGRAESDTAANLVDKVEECLIGLNLEPQQGWAWIAEGRATPGNFVGVARRPHRARPPNFGGP